MIRNVLLALAAILVLALGSVVVGVRTQPAAARGWQEFSIGPAHGWNTTINPTAIHSAGMTLNTLLSAAYTIPRTQILGPEWLKHDRFAITAVAPADGSASMPGLLRQELHNRFELTAHEEEREFAVYVLTAGKGAARLVPAKGREHKSYLPWCKNIERTLTDGLAAKFGLTLRPANRRMPAMIVDHVERGAAVTILSGMGRVTSRWPEKFRRGVSRALSVH